MSERDGTYRQLAALGADLAQPQDLEAILLMAVEGARKLTGTTYTSIGLVEGEVIHWQSAAGKPLEEVKGVRLPIDQGLCGWVVRHGRARRSGDVTREGDYFRQYAEMRSELDVPLMVGADAIGVLSCESPQPEAFTVEHEASLQLLACYAAIALSHGGYA